MQRAEKFATLISVIFSMFMLNGEQISRARHFGNNGIGKKGRSALAAAQRRLMLHEHAHA